MKRCGASNAGGLPRETCVSQISSDLSLDGTAGDVVSFPSNNSVQDIKAVQEEA